MPVLFDFDAVPAITESGGHVVEVTDEQTWSAQRLLARHEGLFVEPAGATALAGLLVDIEADRISKDDDAIVILSGAGHKDSLAAQRLGDDNPTRYITAEEMPYVLEEIESRR